MRAPPGPARKKPLAGADRNGLRRNREHITL
jgi:hypothetical protein